MWLKVRDIKGATIKTILYMILIFIYEYITTNVSTWIGGDIPFVSVWILNDWHPLNKLDVLFYTIVSLRMATAWLGGAFMNLLNLVGGFVMYYYVLAPQGTIGFRGGYGDSYFLFKFQIFPIFLMYTAIYVFLLAFNIYQGWQAHKNPCFHPISIENYKMTAKQKQKIAEWQDIQSRRKIQ